MKIDEIFRYARPYSAELETIDGIKNYFFYTQSPGAPLPLLESGINRIARVSSSDGSRVPAILIRSSPHKVGSQETPWQDIFRPDFGHIRYFGDNKSPGKSPEQAKGNDALLEQFELHHSTSYQDRLTAAPLLCFRSKSMDGRKKGQIEFQGVAAIEKIERVVQIEPNTGLPFVNLSFDFVVFDLLHENECFNWQWIRDRRNPAINLVESLKYAPKSWIEWVNSGKSIFNKVRRSVHKRQIFPKVNQIPPAGSIEEKILKETYSYFDGRKHKFEALASYIASRVIGVNGGTYRQGWLTQASGDYGIDFVGRLDIGSDFASVKLVVLGQAKCEDPSVPTNGNHIARTVARLKRGWIGVYVTTSWFSDNTQKEVLEDQYPIILVDGYRLAKEISITLIERGNIQLLDFLDEIIESYELLQARKMPEEVLLV